MSTPTSTPLTDAAEFDRDEDCSIPDDMVVTADFARDLERRLALADQERDEARKLVQEARDQIEYLLSSEYLCALGSDADSEQSVVYCAHTRAKKLLQALQPPPAPGDNPKTI